jgi:cytoskeletal protein RodZ
VSLGETLARAREGRGLSVEEVARATCIRGAVIRAIESDNFAPCGAPVYARGHIRAIAQVLGVDPLPLVAEFDQLGVDPPTGIYNGPVASVAGLGYGAHSWTGVGVVASTLLVVLTVALLAAAARLHGGV